MTGFARANSSLFMILNADLKIWNDHSKEYPKHHNNSPAKNWIWNGNENCWKFPENSKHDIQNSNTYKHMPTCNLKDS